MRYQAFAFGLRWESELPLPAFSQGADAPGAGVVRVQFADAAARERAFPKAHGHVQLATDGFRYTAEPWCTIDGLRGERLEVSPADGWTGHLPVAFFSTATALLLAMRGALPMHGSAVWMDGKATLICGAAGTGKSTTAARLIAGGARLISDDLTVLHPDPLGGAPLLYAGRRGMRLYPAAAEALAKAVAWSAPPQKAEHKLVVYPPVVSAEEAFRLDRVLILGSESGSPGEEDKAELLTGHFFRPMCLRRMQGHTLRRAKLAIAAKSLDVQLRPAL